MAISFLERYKVMLSILAVIVAGGVLFTSTFQPIQSVNEEPEVLAQQDREGNKEETLVDANQADAGWATATTFEDMVGEDAQDNGFGPPMTSEPGAESNIEDSGFDSPSQNMGPSPFASAEPPVARSERTKPAKRIIVKVGDASGRPIPVDASRVSASAGGKGPDKFGERN